MSKTPFDHQAIRSVVGDYRDPKQSIEERSRIYQDLLGYVPPRIQSRFAVTGAVDPKTGRVYLPTAEYILPVPAGQRPTTKPGTFQVLVLDR